MPAVFCIGRFISGSFTKTAGFFSKNGLFQKTVSPAAGPPVSVDMSIPVKSLGRIKYFPACDETDQEFVWLYRATHSGPFQPDPSEVAGLEWFTPTQIDQMLVHQPGDFSSCLKMLWKQCPR
jgi:hypothetical protein